MFTFTACVYFRTSTELIAYIKLHLSMVMCNMWAVEQPGRHGEPHWQQLCNKNLLGLRTFGSRLDLRSNRSIHTGAASLRGLARFKYRVLLISWVRTQDRPAGVGIGEKSLGGSGKDDTLAPAQAYLDSVALGSPSQGCKQDSAAAKGMASPP